MARRAPYDPERERERALSRARHARNRQTRIARIKQYQAAHPEKVRTWAKNFRVANRALLAERNRRWAQSHREQRNEAQRRRRAAQRDRLLAQRRANRSKNPERERARFRAWYARNAEAQRERARQWAQRNPERVLLTNLARRSRELGARGSHTAQEWREKVALLGGCCIYCGRSDLPLTKDHKIPLTRGGTNDIENLVPACKPCNCQKRTLTAKEFIARRAAA